MSSHYRWKYPSLVVLLLSFFGTAQALTADEKESIECLALNIYHESRNDHYAGQIAVADVVMNRVEDSRYPNTVCDVVKQSKMSIWWKKHHNKDVPIKNQCQFSWYCDGLSDEAKNKRAWNAAYSIAYLMVHNGDYRGITEGATHYHATYVDPYWASSHGMINIGRIGEHVFYRWSK